MVLLTDIPMLTKFNSEKKVLQNLNMLRIMGNRFHLIIKDVLSILTNHDPVILSPSGIQTVSLNKYLRANCNKIHAKM